MLLLTTLKVITNAANLSCSSPLPLPPPLLYPAHPLFSSSGDLHEIAGLFRQVQGLQPSAMACPPNLWNGLHIMYKSVLRDMQTDTQDREGLDGRDAGLSGNRNTGKEADIEAEALSRISSLFGPRIKFLVTGGGPTAAEVTKKPHPPLLLILQQRIVTRVIISSNAALSSLLLSSLSA